MDDYRFRQLEYRHEMLEEEVAEQREIMAELADGMTGYTAVLQHMLTRVKSCESEGDDQ